MRTTLAMSLETPESSTASDVTGSNAGPAVMWQMAIPMSDRGFDRDVKKSANRKAAHVTLPKGRMTRASVRIKKLLGPCIHET